MAEPSDTSIILSRGRVALAASAWEEARVAFSDAVQALPDNAEAAEALATACRSLGEYDQAIAAGQEAYRRYRQAEDDRAAARAATMLALDVREGRGGTAVAAGWLARARNLLVDHPDSLWHSAIDGIEGGLAGLYERDFPRARRLLIGAAAGARAGRDVDGQMLAEAQLGIVLVLSGEIADGLRLLDGATAAAVSGEMREAANCVAVCCMMTAACLSIRDIHRAGEWSSYALDMAAKRGGGRLFDFPRTDHATLLVWRGQYTEAEKELRLVIDDTRGWSRPSAFARLRLADLRRRQARFDEARGLLDEVIGGGFAPLVAAGRARLAFDQDQPRAAADLAETALRLLPADDLVERVDPLEVLARAAAAGHTSVADQAAAQLAQIADRLATPPVRAASALATAALAGARSDKAAQCTALATARDLFTTAEMLPDAESAAATLARAQAARPDLGLTPREVEVLRLVGQGLSNDAIAAQLFLSVRTVEQHVANVYTKIGASGRTARSTATAYAHRNGVT